MKRNKQGFTLLEILLVVAAITILAGIVIVALNPSQQIGDTLDAERASELNAILNGAWQYSLDNGGSIPASINTAASCDTVTAANEVCTTGGACAGLTDLGVLEGTYVAALPEDPTTATANGTGYFVVADAVTNRITVCGDGYNGLISITR